MFHTKVKTTYLLSACDSIGMMYVMWPWISSLLIWVFSRVLYDIKKCPLRSQVVVAFVFYCRWRWAANMNVMHSSLAMYENLVSLSLQTHMCYTNVLLSLWPPYVIGPAIIFLPCGFFLLLLLSFFFFPSPNLRAVGDWMSTVLPHMMWP